VRNTILVGDALERLRELPAESVHCCVTSPPYWGLRDYGEPGQLGLEPTPEEYVANMVEVFREVRRALRDDGTVWLNLGDSYVGSQQTGGVNSISGHGASQPHGGIVKRAPGLKPKDLAGIPWRVAFALQADGWWLRSDIVWAKPNPMPESVTDRPTRAHEYLFLLAKGRRYYYVADAIREDPQMKPQRRSRRLARPSNRAADHGFARFQRDESGQDAHPNGRNKRSVWTVATQPCPAAHFALMPPALVAPCVLAGSPVGGVVLDPFMGAGTVGLVAAENGRDYIGIELNPEYAAMAEHRIANRGRQVEEPLPGQRSLF